MVAMPGVDDVKPGTPVRRCGETGLSGAPLVAGRPKRCPAISHAKRRGNGSIPPPTIRQAGVEGRGHPQPARSLGGPTATQLPFLQAGVAQGRPGNRNLGQPELTVGFISISPESSVQRQWLKLRAGVAMATVSSPPPYTLATRG